jgi:hypothetical protein
LILDWHMTQKKDFEKIKAYLLTHHQLHKIIIIF